MAKLDFFVRYPKFFITACKVLKKDFPHSSENIESSMIRYHYGPWDQRYYHILAYLESRELVKIEKQGNTFEMTLTTKGREIALELQNKPAFNKLTRQMQQVKEVLGSKTGSRLKKLIYETFDREVTRLPLGEVIK